MKNSRTKKRRALFPIGMKLVLIISFIVVVSLGAITVLVSYFTRENDRLKAESNNFTVNTRSAGIAQSFFNQTQSNVYLLMDMVSTIGTNGALSKQSSAYFFERYPEIGAIVEFTRRQRSIDEAVTDDERTMNFLNTRFMQKHELTENKIESFLKSESDTIEKAFQGVESAVNATTYFDTTTMGLFFAATEGTDRKAIVVITSAESLSDTFGTSGTNNSYIVNADGDIIVHPDFEKVRLGTNVSDSPIVKQMRENPDSGRQIFFTDTDGIEYFGAYQKLQFADVGVITTVKASIIYESVESTTRRNIYLTLSVFFLAIIFIATYSKLISTRIKRLTRASSEIERGNFNVRIKNTSNDEITVLTNSFMKMGRGLAERKNLEDTFGKFVNRELAKKALSGGLKLGGEEKNVTVFFSDIRSFTAISEKLTPDEVVGFLNVYMTKMVECVQKTGGTVDKFIGDALMGVWGAPLTSGSVARDAFNCVRAALMMRAALMEFNKDRGGDKKPIIKIGCGINTGPVIAGQIGSEQKMEYTVIGDAVNLASRTEALNKPFGTDILITENTYKLIKDYVLVEEMPGVMVKGKSEPIKMFAVINIPKATGTPGAGAAGPSSLDEVRSMLGIPKPDLSAVDPNKHEEKYKIGGDK
ncbi:MAG: HAMP domain-containing protein [Treponema sp.]|nr:HAMP domain-containing protein [Treponema sp.]